MKKNLLGYTLTFLLIIVLGYFPFWTNGSSLIWHRDGMGQYYPTFLYIGKYIREIINNCLHGNFILPFFDLSIGMGEDIIGSLNYYGFGDPLNLLAVFATKENGAYLFTAMYFLRLYLAGICFRKYSSYMGLDSLLSCAGALCYVFSGYAIVGGARYIQFLAPMIYLPLMLLGCEKIFRERKPRVLVLSVAYAATCTFYFLYMTSLFLIVYFLVRCLFTYGCKQFKKILINMLYCSGSYLLGIMLAAPILLPAIYAFLNSYRSSINIAEILFDINNYIISKDYVLQYIMGFLTSYTITYWIAIPILEFFCIFISVFLFKTKRSRQCGLAVVIGSVLWCIPITRYIFSAFGNNYTRYAFILHFVYAVVFICCVEELLKIPRFGKKFHTQIKLGIFLIIIVNIVINLSLLYGERRENWQKEFINFSSAQYYVVSPVNYTDIITEEISNYRVASDTLTGINERPENVAMLNDYNGLTFWFSIVNGNTQKMINEMGTISRLDWRSYGLNDNSVWETMASVKYYLQHDKNIQKMGYEPTENILFLNDYWKVYKNINVLPLAYTYEKSIADKDYDNLSVIGKMDAILSYVSVNDVDGEIYEDIECNIMHEADTTKKRNDNTIFIECSIDGEKEVYLELPQNSLYNQLEGLSISGSQDQYYKGSKNRDIVYNLGINYSNCQLELSMNCEELSDEDIEEILSQIRIWTIDPKEYGNVIDERKGIEESVIHVLNNRVKIDEVVTKENKWVLLAIPYSKNWRCYVDGNKTQIYRANTMYMAIKLEEGVHQVIFIYKNTIVFIGIAICIIACLGCIILKKYETNHFKFEKISIE